MKIYLSFLENQKLAVFMIVSAEKKRCKLDFTVK